MERQGILQSISSPVWICKYKIVIREEKEDDKENRRVVVCI